MRTKKDLEREITKLQKSIVDQEKLARKVQRDTFYAVLELLQEYYDVEFSFSDETLFSLFLANV